MQSTYLWYLSSSDITRGTAPPSMYCAMGGFCSVDRWTRAVVAPDNCSASVGLRSSRNALLISCSWGCIEDSYYWSPAPEDVWKTAITDLLLLRMYGRQLLLISCSGGCMEDSYYWCPAPEDVWKAAITDLLLLMMYWRQLW